MTKDHLKLIIAIKIINYQFNIFDTEIFGIVLM